MSDVSSETMEPGEESGSGDDSNPRRQLGEVDRSFYIIGVGASAGGLEAIKQLIGQADDNFPHSFVIIQHISPDHKSLMAEILTRETGLPVQEVTDDMLLEAGNIYLIPPKSNVVIQGTVDDNRPETDHIIGHDDALRFSLVAPSPRPQLNLPIDLFFHSLAEAVGDRAIGIILSGTGTDGSRGLRVIKNRDGFVMVQDPDTASFDGMPTAAIATKLVDLVAAPDAMIPELRRYIELRESGVMSVEDIFEDGVDDFARLLREISEVADIDFTEYKEPTLKRRIARRIGLTHCQTLREYVRYVAVNPNELSILHREFLVGVTNFFRDKPAWKTLTDRVIGKLFEEGDLNEPLKVWSVGCSTGEESYTIAFVLEKYRRDNDISRDFRVFASDVNPDAIRAAKDGIYPESVLDEIPEEYRNQDFLTFHGGTFHINPTIRNRVIFNTHNILQEPPYINTDLIICRNLMIYLGPDMQKKVISLFSFSLRNEGVLFLGAAENITHRHAKFDVISSAQRIFSSARPAKSSDIGVAFDPYRPASSPILRMRRLATREVQRGNADLSKIFDTTLGSIQGALLIIEEGGNIIETLGSYRRFIELPDRGFSANIFDLVHERLKSTISILVRTAEKESKSQALATKCTFGERIEVVDLHCNKIEWENHPVAYSIVIRVSDEIAALGERGTEVLADLADSPSVARLETEVEALRELLSVTTEDLGVSNEELQTANEELIVSNEELQANNEEMQSINEELHSVNAENAEKINQLEAAYSDIDNLMRTSELAILLLGRDLDIRRFNPALTEYFELKHSDVGRRISNFTSAFEVTDHVKIINGLRAVIDGDEGIRHEARLADGRYASVRVRPVLEGEAGNIYGAALTILDVSEAKELQDELRSQRDEFERILDMRGGGFWDWSVQSGEIVLSQGALGTLGYSLGDFGRKIDDIVKLIHPDDVEHAIENRRQHLDSNGSVPFDMEIRMLNKNGGYRWIHRRGRIVEWDEAGRPKRMTGTHFDITSYKLREISSAEKRARAASFAKAIPGRLERPVGSLSLGLSDLRNSLSDQTPKDRVDDIDRLKNLSDRLSAYLQGMTNYAEICTRDSDFTDVSLSHVFAEIRDTLAPRIKDAGAKITIEELPLVRGVADLFFTIFLSLLENALNFRAPKRTCQIHVSARTERDKVVIVVRDNGIGVSDADRGSLFDYFARDHEIISQRESISLAGVRSITRFMAGEVEFIPPADGEEGAIFEVTLQAQDKTLTTD